MMTIDAIMRLGPVIPVLTIKDIALAAPIAQALVGGGLAVMEVTLRTPVAQDAIRAMSKVRGAVVGAGTVTSTEELESVMSAGAQFAVSPGLTQSIASRALQIGMPYLPGVSTASDIMRGLELGLDRFKFFPAEAAGGLPALKALAAPFYNCRFCPTGGISENTAPTWLAFEAVLCVGGSWLVDADSSNVEAIGKRASAAAKLGRFAK
jgi:2-dehydro-3-deoxyphosphogluconate aldolase/(4S)-4-hydroxy-2-oxoglutarate aldolase